MSLKKKDPSLRVAATDPHLVSLGGGRLSTAVTIHYIPIGDTTIGSAPTCNISLNGSGVRALHCTIYRSESNEVTLVPERDARLLIDGTRIDEEANLTQGAMITIGNSNYLRFNNPDEAQMMRSAMASSEQRISMPQIDFTQTAATPRQTQPSALTTQSLAVDSFYESIINPVNPTTTAAAATSNVNGIAAAGAAEKTSSLLPCSNGVGIDFNGMQCPKVFSADLVTVNMPAKDVLGQKYASFAKNLAENHRSEKQLNNQYAHKTLPSGSTASGVGHNAGYCNIPSNSALFKQQNNSSSGSGNSTNNVTPIALARQNKSTTEAATTELLTKINNDRYDRYPKPGTYTCGSLQIYPMNGVNTDINNGSELEKMLKICTEYADRQQQLHNNSTTSGGGGSTLNASAGSITSSPIVQNRIKTNGSLPRDKKSPFQQQQQQSGNNSTAGNNSTSSGIGTSSGYENVRLLGPNRVEINGQLHTPANAHLNGSGTGSGSGSGSGSAAPRSSYENLMAAGKYVPQSPRTKIRTNCMSPKKDATFSGSAFVLAAAAAPAAPTTATTTAPLLLPKPPLAPKPPAPNQQHDYEQLFKSFERKQQQEESGSGISKPQNCNKRLNKNINNLRLVLPDAGASPTVSPKPSKKPAPAPRSNVPTNKTSAPGDGAPEEEVAGRQRELLQQQRHELLQRLKQLERELPHTPVPATASAAAAAAAKTDTEANQSKRDAAGANQKLQALQNQLHRLEAQRNATRVMEENQQAKLKQSIEMKQDQMKKLQAMLKQKPNNACLKEELEHVRESLESDRKTFEDLEFQYFEEESDYIACHEELKRQEQRLTLEAELADLRSQLGEETSTNADASLQSIVSAATESVESSPKSSNCSNKSNSINGVMSQSLFGSAEMLCPKRCTNEEDFMSKSVNENMFYNHKIELPVASSTTTLVSAVATVAATSTPKRAPPLQLFEPTLSSAGSCEQISFNLSLRSDRFEGNPLERRVPSQDDIDRSCKVAKDAPISAVQGASSKIFDSIKEIERNRQLLLAQQGHQVIEHERQKMFDLKKKSHDEARTQYLLSTLNIAGHQQKLSLQSTPPQHARANANGGKDAKLFEKTELQKLNNGNAETEPERREADKQPQQTTHDKENLQHQSQLGETANVEIKRFSAGTDYNNSNSKRDSSAQQRHSQPELEHHAIAVSNAAVTTPLRSPRPLSEANNCDAIEAPKFNSNNADLGMDNKRASSNSQDTNSAGSASGNSSSSSSCSNGPGHGNASAGGERKRALPKHQRPLTRYLPIFSSDLNLRHHIETAGHQIDLCPHVFVNEHSCRGYLHKLGATFHAWSRRWFVLDRQRGALIYYSDKSERKPRGGAYFATIDEVYLDHLNASKSGRPHCTFIVKTKKRSYNLQAASDAAARIWIDAIITGAQGNLDY